MEELVSQKQTLKELKKGYIEAEAVIKDQSKLDKILEDVEEKLRSIPKVGDKLANISVFFQLLNHYMSKEYTKVPVGTIVAIASALFYFVSFVDLIPDFIPGIGLLDDGAVVAACLKLVNSDIKEFIKWRDATKQIIIV